MSDDDTQDAPDTAETIGQVAEQLGAGLNAGVEQVPEEDKDARAAMETAGDVAAAAAAVVGAVQAGEQLVEALEDGDEAAAAGAVGNLAGGALGAAGALVDGVADLAPADARAALNTAATVTRAAAGAARATEQVVSSVQAVERSLFGRPIRFYTIADLGDDELRAERASGRQALSGLYEFQVRVEHSEDGGLDDESIDGLLTDSARLGLSRDPNGDGDVCGVLRHVEMLPVSGPEHTDYELTLVPKLWRLKLVRRSRVFQDKSHLEVVLEVLASHGLDLDDYVFDETDETYPTHEYVVQYRETDFDFVSRLLEHNGIHYRFEQHPRSEAMVLGDRNASFAPVQQAAELRYHPREITTGDSSPRVWGLRRSRRPRSAEVVLRDYNWRSPQNPVSASEAIDEATGYGFVDLYGEHVPNNDEGTRLARVRAEQERVGAHIFVGQTSLRGVWPGTYFDLVDHPHGALNQRYAVIETDEAMNDGHLYVNTFKAIPFSVTYRPRRTVPWPRIDGVLNAIVDGEARSTMTPIDDQGRYRVVLPMDDGATAGGRASRWVRRAQPSAGAGYGTHMPLHIGTEVAVGHVNGDPDRPIILGAVPNAATQSPVVASRGTQELLCHSASGVTVGVDNDC